MWSLRRTLLWASAAGFLLSCSVNQTGLTDDGGVQTGTGGTGGTGAPAGHGGNIGPIGSGGAAGTIVTGTAGNGGGPGSGGSAAGGVAGTTGAAGSGGAGPGAAGAGLTTGSAGTSGTAGNSGDVGGNGGNIGSAGSGGTGNAAGAGSGAAGNSGIGGAGNVAGTGGIGGNVGSAGSGGAAGTIGGRGGRGGFGTAGRGGTSGNSGRGGTGGNPCTGYPSGAKAFVTPTDGRTHCYWPRSTTQTWSEAQQSCTLQNGHLVTILSAEENAFVVSVAQFSSSFNDTWIGATDGKAGADKNGPGTYKWVTNETWGYSNWEQGQPDGFCDPCSAGQSCTCDHRAVLASNGTWNDRWQDNNRSSVCEATPN
jgi:hypothetical protein